MLAAVCKTDNFDLIDKSGKGVTLTSTAMKSLEDRSVYFGKRAQWAALLKDGCIENIACFEEEERILDANFHLARGREQTISHKFCFAANTGTCGRSNTHAPVTSTWHKNDFCPNWMIQHPANTSHLSLNN